MQTRSRERQEEYREQLRIYALSYLLFVMPTFCIISKRD